ncbi:DUF2634 domain-containing protein [Paenibacillus validus]|uniref:DUF2634 domain-containing protein n=1 Tax=Paenibacillus validus TaxID=44253 RepID=UPI000FD79CD4|nr:DUF2634 domain-containing protein [Paenibacillus validus]MED4599864.1 DUF2634 domain-containing protein [Paenibacillus validus]MED4606103.1 DUF2634 domain-containing protein [Paenibacillus validus]
MLPKIAQLEYDSSDTAPSTTVHKTYDWDFDAGDFRLSDGKMIELTGAEYLKVWIQKALRSAKDSLIYAGTGFGSEHHSLIGKSFNPAFSQAEYERMIRETLLGNDAISRVDNFAFSQTGSRLTISFDVQSIYGTQGEEVTI